MAKYHGKHYYLGAWNYAFLDILYLIPVIGLIFLLIHSFSDKNENRRHYARSYFARFLLGVLICAVAAGIFYLAAGSEAFRAKWAEITGELEHYANTVRY